ncbi:MAG TPA: cadherin-like beta sandwich domain-containing protein [Bacilli bacterium]|jgi:prepilin-type N-terminal cleavage/methylation domain-containing protein|nr:cadherin-like beta sandwich domain-containing protein [Bacilli bacterium]HQC83743.1 cadherin-like beta sandwich domain-containing protein [Bacilli bacterium]
MKKKSGFTLVELLAVLIILAIIMVIAIPAILNVMEDAKKHSFYMYALSMEQKALAKYTDDINTASLSALTCTTYNISNDLGISNTGNYKGWVRISREASSSGNYNYKVTLDSTSTGKPLYYVKYCTFDNTKTSCTPDTTYFVSDNTYTTTISQTLAKNQGICANYQTPNASGSLVTTATTCSSGGTAIENDTYLYNVTITLRDNSRAVENVPMSSLQTTTASTDADITEENFLSYMDAYKKNHASELANLPISEPTCDGSAGETISNNMSNNTTKVTTTENAGSNTTKVTTSVNPDSKTTEVTTSTTTTADTEHVTTSTTTTETAAVTTKVTTEASTTKPIERTTIVENNKLLSSLSVGGYDIGFSSTQLTYHITVPYNTEQLAISAIPYDGSTYDLNIGTGDINVGDNTIPITLTNKSTGVVETTYIVYVKRLGGSDTASDSTTQATTTTTNNINGLPDPTLAASDASLSGIAITNYNLGFSSDVYDYTLNVEDDVNELYLTPYTTSPGAVATVSGNENLENNSVITISVKSENGYYYKTYTITVHKQGGSNVGTKVLRGVAAGLGVVLVSLIIILGNSRKHKKIAASAIDAVTSNITNNK